MLEISKKLIPLQIDILNYLVGKEVYVPAKIQSITVTADEDKPSYVTVVFDKDCKSYIFDLDQLMEVEKNENHI